MSSSPRPVHRPDRIAQHWWETPEPPPLTLPSRQLEDAVAMLLSEGWPELAGAPFLPRDVIDSRTLSRVNSLLDIARNFPIYSERLAVAGIARSQGVTFEEFRQIRPVTKDEMKLSYSAFAAAADHSDRPCYRTRSSGSSGVTVDIVVDEPAIATDTAHGFRQLVLQSGRNFRPDDCVAHVYTVPWPVDEVNGQFVSHFISSLMHPQQIMQVLRNLRPAALSLYPTSLEGLISRGHMRASDLSAHLIITHSEQSTATQRARWSQLLGVNVRDEYSSEEAARIALEFPCGHYHTCDDAVYVEILDPETWRPQEPGKLGAVVITNLLNEAMPFIRYVQGDLAVAGSGPDCPVQWGILESLQGRRNDAFINCDQQLVAAGALLDATYRAMFDNGLSFDFELIQTSPSEVVFRHSSRDEVRAESLEKTLGQSLHGLFGHPVVLSSVAGTAPSNRPGKRRPIRRAFSIVESLSGRTELSCGSA